MSVGIARRGERITPVTSGRTRAIRIVEKLGDWSSPAGVFHRRDRGGRREKKELGSVGGDLRLARETAITARRNCVWAEVMAEARSGRNEIGFSAWGFSAIIEFQFILPHASRP